MVKSEVSATPSAFTVYHIAARFEAASFAGFVLRIAMENCEGTEKMSEAQRNRENVQETLRLEIIVRQGS